MCGINFTPLGSEILAQMNDNIKHRGLPGRTGSYTNGEINLGHVRLPINGLGEEYDQPMQENGRVLVFAGEIFNYRDFSKNLSCDTEILFQLWESYGPFALSHLDGFWSFIHFDSRFPDQISVVTDDLAKKPLYIHLPTMSVSSEIKAFHAIEPDYEFDPLYFSSVAKWGYHIGERTYMDSVRKLPPGCVITIDLAKMQFDCVPWINLQNYRTNVPLDDALRTAVRNRLVGDVPVSILLSGGIDSSIIYKMVLEQTRDFTIFHVDNDEAIYLDHLDIPGDIQIKTLDIKDVDLGEVLYYNEGPVDLGSMLPQFAMSSAIKDSPVVLTGDGADELFGGYRRMSEYDAQYSDIFEELVYYHLPRLDKLSMAKTLELRSPFLARDVIGNALALPYSERVDKKYLKDTFRHLLPASIVDRKKHPLKSKQVLSKEGWRMELIKKFKEVSNEHQRR